MISLRSSIVAVLVGMAVNPLNAQQQEVAFLAPTTQRSARDVVRIPGVLNALEEAGVSGRVVSYDIFDPNGFSEAFERARAQGVQAIVVLDRDGQPVSASLAELAQEHSIDGPISIELGNGWAAGDQRSGSPVLMAIGGASVSLEPVGLQVLLTDPYAADPEFISRLREVTTAPDNGSSLARQLTIVPRGVDDPLTVIQLANNDGCGCDGQGIAAVCDPFGMIVFAHDFAFGQQEALTLLAASNRDDDGCGCNNRRISGSAFRRSDMADRLLRETPEQFNQIAEILERAHSQGRPSYLFVCDPD